MKPLLLVFLALACGSIAAQENAPVRLRGSIERFSAPHLVIKERGGEVIALVLPEETGIVQVIPTDIAAIQPGSYIGTAALTRADGKLEALEVVVFPEAARGAGEGHHAWDLQPQSSMTNATVAELSRAAHGRIVKLRYKDGEQIVTVPDGVPIVTLRPGDRSMIVPGARVFIVAEPEQNKLMVRRLMVGRDGLTPPM